MNGFIRGPKFCTDDYVFIDELEIKSLASKILVVL